MVKLINNFGIRKIKLWTCYICLIISILSVSSCTNSVNSSNGNEQTKVQNEFEHITGLGNTQGNILNSGFVAKGDGWIYGTVKGFYLSRMSLDGKKIEDLNKDLVDCINVIENYVFYRKCEWDTNSMPIKNMSKIYRIDMRTKKIVKISDDSINYFYIYNGKIYYSKVIQNNKGVFVRYDIYRMGLNGTSKELVYSEKDKPVFSNDEFVIDNGYLYFISTDGNSKIYKYYIKGKKLIDISRSIPQGDNKRIWGFIVDNGYIYFDERTDDTDNLYRMTINGENHKLLVSNMGPWFNVDKDWIYYTWSNPGDYDYKLYKVKKDGKGKMKLSDIDARNINIIDNWIYCNGGNREANFYKISTDGYGKYIQLRSPGSSK